jgi:hypothetical protein
MSFFSTPSPPSEAGGTGPAGGRPDFPSPTKLVRNGLTGTELGAHTLCVCMSSIESVPKIKSDGILFWGLDVERQEDPPFAKPPAAALRAAARHPA